MSVRRRLEDALSSPTRFFWFVVRTIHLALTGRIRLSVARLFPHTASAPSYERWIAETETKQDLSRIVDPSVLAAPPIAFLITTTAETLPGSFLHSSGQKEQTFPNCWLTCTSGSAWRAPIRWPRELSSAPAPGAALPPLAFLEALAEVERQAHKPVWVILIAEGVVLEAKYLAIIATITRRWPRARLIYADHDQVNGEGRHDPVFKPAWDPIQIHERNYVGPSWAVEASLLRQCFAQAAGGRLDVGSLLLKCSQAVQPGEVLHIPRVLWHRRDTSGDGDEREARLAPVQPIGGDTAPSQGDMPLVSVIIPARDCVNLTSRCIASLIARTRGCAYEILLIDNGSSESATWDYYERELIPNGVQVLYYPGPFNFSKLCNAGAASSQGSVLVFLNNDTEIISPDWLTELRSLAVREECGAVGPLLLHADGTIQHAGILMGLNGTADRPLVNVRPDHAKARDWCSARRVVGAVLGACLAIERDKFRAIGGMDPRYAVSHNEVDLCLRLARAGHMSVFTPHVRLIHLESGTRGYDLTPSQRAKLNEESEQFASQWGPRSQACDPAYHPNFKLNGNPFALASIAPPCVPRIGWDAAVLSADEPEQPQAYRSARDAVWAADSPQG
jgi:GT2 family glycosyltransferase